MKIYCLTNELELIVYPSETKFLAEHDSWVANEFYRCVSTQDIKDHYTTPLFTSTRTDKSGFTIRYSDKEKAMHNILYGINQTLKKS